MGISFTNLSVTTKIIMRRAKNQGYGTLKLFNKREIINKNMQFRVVSHSPIPNNHDNQVVNH